MSLPPSKRDERIPIDPQGVAQLLNDLARARVEFQLRAIKAVLGAPESKS